MVRATPPSLVKGYVNCKSLDVKVVWNGSVVRASNSPEIKFISSLIYGNVQTESSNVPTKALERKVLTYTVN